MAVISLNYDRAIEQVDQLKKAADKCTEQAAMIQKQIDAIQANWTGDTGNILVQRLSEWKSQVSSEANNLYGLATRVQNKATLLKNIDEKKD